MSIREPLDALETEFEAANVQVGEATWNIYSGEGAADLDGAQRALAAVLTRASARRLVEEAPPGDDPVLARRLAVWRNTFAGAAVESAPEVYTLRNRLQERIAGFRFELDGAPAARSELQRIVRTDPDRERRRRAWRATARLAAANRDDLRRLIGLRNAHARRLGYRDYPDLVFRVQEIDEAWLLGTLETLGLRCQPRYARWVVEVGERLGADPAPWDVAWALREAWQLEDRRFPASAALDALARTARRIGFPVDDLPIRTVVRDIPFGGYNVAVRIPTDTRFLVNPSEGHGFYTTTFHEFGHSLQAVYTATEWPILKEYEWALGAHNSGYAEGMAETLGEFARRPDWLAGEGGLSGPEIERYTGTLLPVQRVVRLFDLLANLRIELDAYRTEADVDARERAVVRDLRRLAVDEDEPSHWAANTWYTTYPVYWQNYILSALVACQVHAALDARFGAAAGSDAGVSTHLRDAFYASGNAVPWHERIRRGTGRPLGSDAFLKSVGA